MPAAGRTARGLERPPQNPARKREEERTAQTGQTRKGRRRRRIQHAVFSLGNGLDMPLFVFIMVLLAIGLVMLFSASYANSYYYEDNSYHYITRQGAFALFGIAAMLLISTFDYHRFHQLAMPIAVISIVLLLMVLLFGRVLKIKSIAPAEGVATRWLQLGPLGFQPSEVAKFALIVVFAHMISLYADKMGTFRYGVLPFVGVLGLFAALVFLENHMSGTLIILALGAILMFVGGTKPRWFVLGGALLAVLLVGYLVFGGKDDSGEGGVYQMDRIAGWLDPFGDKSGSADTWQIKQSLYAIVCEELGMVGALVIMLLFALLIWRGVYISLHAKDRFGVILGLGLTFQVGLQAVLNICVVTNTIPNTGISLPFFSSGGTALLMLLGQMGILLNISRSSNVEKT